MKILLILLALVTLNAKEIKLTDYTFGFYVGNTLYDADLHDRDGSQELKAIPNLEFVWHMNFEKNSGDKNTTIREVYKFSNSCIPRHKLNKCEEKECVFSEGNTILTCKWTLGDYACGDNYDGAEGYFTLSPNIEECELNGENTLEVYVNDRLARKTSFYVKSQEEYEKERVYIKKERFTYQGLTYESNLNPLIETSFLELDTKDWCQKKLPDNKQNHIEEVLTMEEPQKYHVHTKPNYAKMYPNTPQIILPKAHIYDVKKLSYFRDKKEIIFIEASSGNYAVPKKELQDAKYLLLTKALQKRLSALGVNTTQE